MRQHQRLAEVERSLEVKRRELAALERHDPLTGACNRREFELALRREFKRVQRDQGRLALAVLDVDHLKPYNERHGREAGDAVLQRLAALLSEQGLDPARLEDSHSQAAHERYELNTQQAIGAGVFGSPSYVVEGEIFWGQDRLDFLERKLRSFN